MTLLILELSTTTKSMLIRSTFGGFPRVVTSDRPEFVQSLKNQIHRSENIMDF